MKNILGILVLAAFVSMAGRSYAASGDNAFEREFAAALASPAPVNDFAFEQTFAHALASSEKQAAVPHQTAVQNKFETDDAFTRPFRTAFAASYGEIADAMQHKIAKDRDTSNAAYAYAIIGMLKRGITMKGGEQTLDRELRRIGYSSETRFALK